LIEMMRGDEVANRDWATFILAQEEMNSSVVRDAFMRVADDSDADVHSEACEGGIPKDL